MMETQVLIQEIQKKHQITLKPEDPVFVAVTLNDLLLSHYLEKFQVLLEAQNRLVISEGIERLNQASAMGGEMINRSLEALSQVLEQELSQVDKHVTGINEPRSQQQRRDLEKMIFLLRWGMGFVIVCSCLNLFVFIFIMKTHFSLAL